MSHSNRVTMESLVDLIIHLKWKSDVALHTDGFQANRVNIWRDYLPREFLDELINKEPGERIQVFIDQMDTISNFNPGNLLSLENAQFDRDFLKGSKIHPRVGRFYPKGMLKGIPGIFRANTQSFRCVGFENGSMTVDFNHPLAGKRLELSAVISRIQTKKSERGGESLDWLNILTQGPGMQTRWRAQETDYFSDNAFERRDEESDAVFYREPRYVQHIDDTAREMIRNTYGRFLTNGMSVLDLMGSWVSHIPPDLDLDRLVGLGMNRDELKRNSGLTDYRVHDLNADPLLPFETGSFDAVINTVSVEYLTGPLAVFKEVSRILRPEGFFIVTFSNRWFPTKAVRIWEQIHEFERMGLVLEYFLRSGGFKDLHTYSIRGLPRPHDDKYFPEMIYSDPVYAVWGRKSSK